jgi:hypothetical protein
MSRAPTFLLAALLAGCATTSGAPATADTTRADSARADTAQLAWRPSWPGTTMAITKGDPFTGGEWSFRFRMPAGYWIHPHRHPVDARIRVISGTFLVGHGEQLDSTRVDVLTPGRTITLQLGMPHYEGTRGETVIEVSGTGTWGIAFVDPARDPAAR